MKRRHEVLGSAENETQFHSLLNLRWEVYALTQGLLRGVKSTL